MNRAWLLAAVAVVVAFTVGVLAARSLFDSSAAVTSTAPTALERNVLAQINVQRVAHGLQPVRYDPVLARAAELHNRDMLDRDYFSHDEPHGLTYAQRVARLLYSRHRLGEIIATGSGPYGTAVGLVNGWMHSPEHRRIILTAAMHRCGVGAGKAAGRYLASYGMVVATAEFSS